MRVLTLRSRLPKDRFTEGQIWLEDGWKTLFGPARCRGEADNSNAARSGNPNEEPTLPGGDHPAGTYRIVALVKVGPDDPTYGPWFIRLDPVAGEALEAKHAGRSGLGIHGGRLHPDGRLRETFGCLRVDDRTLASLVWLIHPDVEQGVEVPYLCEVAS